jgi:hypothetical protein
VNNGGAYLSIHFLQRLAVEQHFQAFVGMAQTELRCPTPETITEYLTQVGNQSALFPTMTSGGGHKTAVIETGNLQNPF